MTEILIGSCALLIIGLLIFFKRPPKVIQVPMDPAPEELEKKLENQEKIKQIKDFVDKRDNATAELLKKRGKELEKNLKSPPSVDDIKSKLVELRTRSKDS